jgi:hypothetical protein
MAPSQSTEASRQGNHSWIDRLIKIMQLTVL